MANYTRANDHVCTEQCDHTGEHYFDEHTNCCLYCDIDLCDAKKTPCPEYDPEEDDIITHTDASGYDKDGPIPRQR